MMPKRRWKWIAVWTVLLTVVALFGLNMILSVVWGFGHPILEKNDPDTGYIVAPSQYVVRFGNLNEINRFSMRSPEIITPKPAGEFRLLMIGDSITYGTTYVDQSEIFTSLLNRDLPARLRKNVEVLNASAGGWAPGNELGYLRSRGTFDADMVIFVINTGDLTQTFSKSLVDISPGSPSHDPSSALAEVFERYLLPRLRHEIIADAGSKPVPVDVQRETPPKLAILGKAKTLAIQAGAYFAVVYIPAQGSEWAAYAPGFRMLKNWCKMEAVDLVDLTPEFSKCDPAQIAFDNGHGHLRPAGHAIVAKVVADYLASGNWSRKKLPATRMSTHKALTQAVP
jgi:lysophospholipase L1-like esterase